MSSSISGAVQIDNPYGIAFLSAVCGLFSEKLFELLEDWMNGLGKSELPPPPPIPLSPPPIPLSPPPEQMTLSEDGDSDRVAAAA